MYHYVTSIQPQTFVKKLVPLLAMLMTMAPLPCWAQKKGTQQPQQPIRVLCIDGGGVRGIIPARILQALEEKAGRPIHELFDIIVGTSTGGLIGLAITMPDPKNPSKAMYKAQDLVQFYLQESPKIFQTSIWRKLRTGFGIWGAKYDRKHIDKALQALLKDSRLSQALCHVGVLSYSIEKHLPRLWTSYMAQKYTRKDHYIRDAAAATSAAPTYFAPKTVVSPKGQERLTEVDGGIYANNPAIAAMIAVADLYPHFRREALVIVALGTGKSKKQAHDFKGIRGISHLISDMMSANGELVDGALEAILPNYYQFQLVLPKKSMPMDNGDPQHLQKLIEHAEQLLVTRDKDIDRLLQHLVR